MGKTVMVSDQISGLEILPRLTTSVFDFTFRLEVSTTATALVTGYVGTGHKLYIELGTQSVQSLIQCAAWVAAHEEWLVETLERERDKQL